MDRLYAGLEDGVLLGLDEQACLVTYDWWRAQVEVPG